jgi:Ca-activated chloride channel family protein
MRTALLVICCTLLCGCRESAKNQPAPNTPAANNGPVFETDPLESGDDKSEAQVIAPKRAALQFGDGTSSTKRNIYVVFDGSGSMNNKLQQGGNQRFRNKIEGAKWAVGEFMKTIPDDINLGLFVFDAQGVRQVVPLEALDRAAFLAAINDVSAAGGTPLGESIKAGVDALMKKYQQQLGYGEFRLIVVTDGEARPELVADAVQYAEDFGVPIYTIGLDVNENHSLRAKSRQFFSAKSFEELKRGLIDSAAESETFDANDFSQQP